MPKKLPIINEAGVILGENATILRAMEAINGSDARIALITDATGKLIGSATDGDVRRGLLGGCALESPVSQIMHKDPYTLPLNTPRQQILDTMSTRGILQVPLIHDDGTLAGITTFELLSGFAKEPRANPVVIMAGGKGKRLLPLTDTLPKPMVEIGGRPILEWILERFTQQGFREFYFAVNYLGHIIKDHFGDGTKFGCNISYINEPEFMGTAGALSLIDAPFKTPFIVMNGDILASIDFGSIIDYHDSVGSVATVCARPHRMEVPYGVIQLKDGMLQAIVEKPVYEDLVSAGIYVLAPSALKFVPKNTPTDMPNLLLSLIEKNNKVAVFPMREEWVDVGRHDDLERAKLSLPRGNA